MIYLLDTNTCITFLRNRPSPVLNRMRRTQGQDMVLCSIVVAELYEGAYRSARQAENLDLVTRFRDSFTVLAFDTLRQKLLAKTVQS